MKRLQVCALLAFSTCAIASILPKPGLSEETSVTSRPISAFATSGSQNVFGKLQFVGGLEMNSASGALGAWSSLRFYPDQTRFIGVLDTGHWITGAIQRGKNGALSGVTQVDITSMLDQNGDDHNDKWKMDSEGVALRGDQILVSFEQRHRIDVYPAKDFATSAPLKSLPVLIPVKQLKGNLGLETLVVSPSNGPLKDAPLVVAERSLNKQGNHLAAILEGPQKGVFSVKRNKPFSITDGAFLPNGDLLLLERRFGLADGIGAEIRRIKGADIKPGATVDGPVIFSAGAGTQIDNMEGLDVIAGPGGDTSIILVSDDNHSLFQRNLMLEFRLLP
jgi:hypothetical protein